MSPTLDLCEQPSRYKSTVSDEGGNGNFLERTHGAQGIPNGAAHNALLAERKPIWASLTEQESHRNARNEGLSDFSQNVGLEGYSSATAQGKHLTMNG